MAGAAKSRGGSAPLPARRAERSGERSWLSSTDRGSREGGGQPARRVLARDDLDCKAELARSIGGDRPHARNDRVTEHGRQLVLRKRADEIHYGRGAGERDEVHALGREQLHQRGTRVGRADGLIDGKDVDLSTSFRKERW